MISWQPVGIKLLARTPAFHVDFFQSPSLPQLDNEETEEDPEEEDEYQTHMPV